LGNTNTFITVAKRDFMNQVSLNVCARYLGL
jgi:hypothetical protein